jgi:hypothetical protein
LARDRAGFQRYRLLAILKGFSNFTQCFFPRLNVIYADRGG